MNETKKAELIAAVSPQPEAPIIPIDQFFDGNEDLGSIGCNLIEHPGINRFHETLTGLLHRPDVNAVFALITELDPGEGYWPFTDTILVVGSISVKELRHVLAPLEPDEVGTAEELGAPSAFLRKQDEPVLAAWWD